MTTTRNGKFARLPRVIREQVNRRLDDGEDGATLLPWINGLPEVRELLAREFGGEPINGQNLTNWRQGGFLDWQRQQDALAAMRALAEEGRELDAAAGGAAPADLLATRLTASLAGQVAAATAMEDGPDKLRALLALARETARLRHGDHNRRRMEQQAAQQQAERAKARETELAALAEEVMENAPGDALHNARSIRDSLRQIETYDTVYRMAGKRLPDGAEEKLLKLRQDAKEAQEYEQAERGEAWSTVAAWEREDDRRLAQRAQLLADGQPVPEELEIYVRMPLAVRLRRLRHEEEEAWRWETDEDGTEAAGSEGEGDGSTVRSDSPQAGLTTGESGAGRGREKAGENEYK